MSQWVEISFDCLPLRSIGRLEIPIDASPKYQEKCRRIKNAIEKHGSHNSYFLHNAMCIYHVTNDPNSGAIKFRFSGTVLTNREDDETASSDLEVELVGETCDWLTEPIVEWFASNVRRSVEVEFDKYIEVGDLERAHERIEKIQSTSDESGGYLGMYL